MSVQAYPLQWPAGWPRCQHPIDSNFDTSLSKASAGVLDEIRRLGGTNIVISSNMQLKADGMPYARQMNLEDTGVAVYFNRGGQQLCFACDRYIYLADNVQAIRKTIEALRGIERWGASDMMQRAFSGFAQLQAPAPQRERTWREVFGYMPDEVFSLERLRSDYRCLATKLHPDKGGSDAAMSELNRAYQQALEEVK